MLTHSRIVPYFATTAVITVLAVMPSATQAVGDSAFDLHAARALAFEHVTVVPMDRERVLERYTVLVRGGRIAAMGPDGSVRVPTNALRVDGNGRYLMPGLADMHVHPYNADQFLNYLAHGVTTIAVLNGSRNVLRWRAQIARGGDARANDLHGRAVARRGPSRQSDFPLDGHA